MILGMVYSMNNDLNIIKEARKNKDMTQQELADSIGVTKAYINKIENGVTKKPSLNVLERLASILDINYVDIVEEFGYDIEDLISEQTIIKFFREYEPSEEVNIKYLYNKKEYMSEDIMNDFINDRISQLDAIYLFINLIEVEKEKKGL